MKKTVYKIFLVMLLILFSACAALAIQLPVKNAHAAGGSEIVISSTLSEIKTNAAGEQFTVSATVKNNTGTTMLGAQVKLSFDTKVFAFVSFNKSTDIENSEYDRNNSTTDAGYITMMGDDNGKEMSKTQWKIASITLKIKEGASLTAGTSSQISASEIELLDSMGEDANPVITGENLAINFVSPSNECKITELSVNKTLLTPSGFSYTCEVPYAYKALNDLKVKVSTGAKYTVSKTNLDVGANAVTITVTAEDGSSSQAYTLNITRKAAEQIRTLSALSFKNNGTPVSVTPEINATALVNGGTFDAGQIAYADKDRLRIEFTKNGNFTTADIMFDGNKLGNTVIEATSGCNLGTVSAGAHTVTVKVYSEDKSAFTEYNITFSVIAAEEDSTLSSLSLKIVKADGDETVNFAESFSPDRTTYSATVPQGTTKVKVEAQAAGQFSGVSGLGEYSVPGSIVIKVTSQSGVENIYTIVVVIAKDTSGLALSNVSAVGLKKDGNTVVSEHQLVISETSVADYFTVSIPFTLEITHFKIKADPFVSDEYRVEGTNYDIEINRAEKTKHIIRFIKNNIVEKTITYDIIYESNVKTLSKLTYDGIAVDLSTGLNYFFVEVTKDVENLNIVPTTTDPNASATVISIINDKGTPAAGKRTVKLSGGINPILISVKATNGDEGTYVLCVLRPLGSQMLTSLKCDENDLDVSDNTNIYGYEVTADVDSVMIYAAAIEGATVTLYDSQMNELSLSEKVSLSGGNNPYFIKVTAEDGTVSGYTINISRAVSETNNSMPYIVAIIVISVISVLIIIALTVVIVVNRRRS